MNKKARNVGDFKAEHDPDTKIPNQIRAALADMLKEGPENWATNAEFATRAHINTSTLTKYRDQFKPHLVEIFTKARDRTVAWFADPKVAAKVRRS